MRSSRKSSLASLFLDTTHREAVRPAAVAQRAHTARIEAQAACVVAAGRVRRGRPIVAVGADTAELARTEVAIAGSRIKCSASAFRTTGIKSPTDVERTADIELRRSRSIASCRSKPCPCVLGRNSPTGRTRVVNGFGTFRGIRRCRRIGITPKIVELPRRRGSDPIVR